MKAKWLIVFAMLFQTMAYAIGVGGKESGGGDAYSFEFVSMARALSNALEKNPAACPIVDAGKFKVQVDETRVVSVEKAVLNGAEVDAINHPDEKLIEISRSRWDDAGMNSKRKLSLVAHEYLSVMGLKDDHYQISDTLAPVINQVLADKSPMNSTFHVDDMLAENSLGVIEYHGGFVQGLTLTLDRPRFIKMLQLAIPAFCKTDVNSVEVISNGVSVGLEQTQFTGGLVFSIRDGEGLTISAIVLTLNGPENIGCHIPVYNGAVPKVPAGLWSMRFTFPGNGPKGGKVNVASDGSYAGTYDNSTGFSGAWGLIEGYFFYGADTNALNGFWSGIFDGVGKITGTTGNDMGGGKFEWTLMAATFQVDDVVEATKGADLYSGQQVVGQVVSGDKFRVVAVQGDWVSLKKLDGTVINGWISASNIKASTL